MQEASERRSNWVIVSDKGIVGKISNGVVVEAEIFAIGPLVDGVGIAVQTVVAQVEQGERLTVKGTGFEGLDSVLR